MGKDKCIMILGASILQLPAIKKALEIIDGKYDNYSSNARSFYDSCDIDSILKEIVQKEIGE